MYAFIHGKSYHSVCQVNGDANDSICRVPKAAVDAALSYCHNNLADNTITTLLPYLAEKEVALISASFSSMGLLTQKVGFSFHRAKIVA